MFASQHKPLHPETVAGGGCNGIKRVLYYVAVDSIEFVEEVEDTIATLPTLFRS